MLSVKDCVSRPDYHLDGRRLENVDSHPYLGIELAYNLKWSRHIDNIVAKASGHLNYIIYIAVLALVARLSAQK